MVGPLGVVSGPLPSGGGSSIPIGVVALQAMPGAAAALASLSGPIAPGTVSVGSPTDPSQVNQAVLPPQTGIISAPAVNQALLVQTDAVAGLSDSVSVIADNQAAPVDPAANSGDQPAT